MGRRLNNGQEVIKSVVYTAALLLVTLVACEQEPPDETGGGFAPAPETPPADAVPIGNEDDLMGIVPGVYKSYRLDTDITVSEWMPLCSDTPFTGAFYGMNRTITINSGEGGVFDSIKGASVYNLRVNVKAGKSVPAGYGGQFGGIAGNAQQSYIKNCTAEVDFAFVVHTQNSSAGGIVGYMLNYVSVLNCAASGNIKLSCDPADSILMIYAGGIAGYSGNGTADNTSSGGLIEKSSWTGSASSVTVTSDFPYAGGIVGYNYAGAAVVKCFSTGTVTAVGKTLPYAGGVAGYNSSYAANGVPAKIENCYSTASVKAESASKAALAGGIAGANAKRARIRGCYATGAVTAQVSGAGESDLKDSIGPMVAASAGGIAGAQYVETPRIQNCAALNASITGTDSTSGAEAWNIYRIAGAGTGGNNEGAVTGNIAYSGMTITNHAPPAVANDPDGRDGKDTATATPGQSVYEGEGMGWDFGSVWKMSGGYPVLR
jgi:hypothetical protein